jgi:hypothetical protein
VVSVTPRSLNPWEETPLPIAIVWLGLRAGLDILEKRNLLPPPRFELRKIAWEASKCVFFTKEPIIKVKGKG